MVWKLNIEGEAVKEFDTLSEVYECLNNAYLAVEDQYEGILRWNLQLDNAKAWHEGMPAALWYACCENSEVFERWLLNICRYKKEILKASLNDGWVPDGVVVND